MIQVQNISRSFGERLVLDGVSFDIEPGKLTGFVGGNGAGKTTTMRIIMGVLAADSGQVLLDGRAVTTRDAENFGYMPEERGLYPKMSLDDQLVYLARLHGLTAEVAKRRADDLLDRLGLAQRAKDHVEKLSLGNQQRIQVAAALVHDPSFLVMDEPFSGLDPLAVDVVLNVLSERAAAGVPVLFSSHQLDVVERLCDNLVVLADGKIREAGNTQMLRERHAGSRYRIKARGDMSYLRGVPGLTMVDLQDGQALFDADEASAQLALRAALDRAEVRSFERVIPRLAEVFKELVRDVEHEEVSA